MRLLRDKRERGASIRPRPSRAMFPDGPEQLATCRACAWLERVDETDRWIVCDPAPPARGFF
jgi:hypothetical protein